MSKRIIPLLILASATIALAQVPTYELDRILPAPGCTSVDLSPDGTKIYASVCYQAVTNQGYEAYDADTYDFLRYYQVPSSAPWVGLVSSDSAYLWTTTYYGGYVKKIDLQTGGVAKSIDLGHWTAGMAFDSQRRYLYVGENVPGGWATGSLQVVDTLTESVVGSVTLNGEPGLKIILDSTDSYVYLVTRNPGSETLYKIATSDYSFTTLALPGIGSHAGISLSPDGGTAYVKGRFDDIVHLIDTDTITEFNTFSIVDALGFCVSPDGTHALTMNRTGDVDIRIFDFATESIIQTIDLGPIGTMSSTTTPYWDLARGKVYVPTWLMGGGVAVLAAEPSEPPPEPWSFVQITDTHIGALFEDADLSLAAAVLEICNLSPSPDFVLVTGDIADRGCRLFCGKYDLFKSIMEDLEYKNIKYYCIPGNHDWLINFAGYESVIGLPEDVNPLPLAGGVGNYLFEHKGFMLIGLDTGPGTFNAPNHLTDEQMWGLNSCAWQGTGTPKIVFMHHPAAGGGGKMISRNRLDFLDWCDAHDAKAVITGHTHEDVVCDRNGNEGWPVGKTAYVQTPSCGTGAVGDRGYRIFDVIGGKLSERGVSHIQNTLDYYIKIKPLSPVDLHVYDSQGGHVGLTPSGEVERGIPRSFYLPKHSAEIKDGTEVYPEKIVIFDPTDDYLYEVVGTEEGTYGLDITSVSGGEATTFEATDIPTSPGARHVYAVDWQALSAGEEGVILKIDNNGDGFFEQMAIADNELSYDEFALQAETVVDFDPDTLNLKSKGKFVTVYIELPDDFDVSEIDLFSLELNELVPPLPKPIEIGDYDSDGTNDLMVKFDLQELIEVLEPGEQIIDLTGRLWDGRRIAGFDFIRVIH